MTNSNKISGHINMITIGKVLSRVITEAMIWRIHQILWNRWTLWWFILILHSENRKIVHNKIINLIINLKIINLIINLKSIIRKVKSKYWNRSCLNIVRKRRRMIIRLRLKRGRRVLRKKISILVNLWKWRFQGEFSQMTWIYKWRRKDRPFKVQIVLDLRQFHRQNLLSLRQFHRQNPL